MKRSITVNFNNVRRNACRSYDRLVKKLNRARTEDGQIVIDIDELEDVLNDLRMSIGTIASTYEEDNDEFIDVFEEMYPNEDDHMEFFNPEKEDEN